MQLTPSFIILLGSLLAVTTDTYAIPLTPRQRGIVTLPIKRTPLRNDLHPRVLLQMHSVRSQQRLARMTGREVPSAEVLLDRRSIHKDHIAGRSPPRFGHPGAELGSNNGPGVVSTNGAAPGVGTSVLAAAGGTGGGSNPTNATNGQNDPLTPAAPPRISNSLGLAIEADDIGYIATIQMGTPPRDFNVLMDSGSADLWVGAEGCKTDVGGDCGNHVFLGPQSSTSFVDTGASFQVTYGSGSVSGNLVTDDITVAGLQLFNHTFGVANVETINFSQAAYDGIMGVAQSTISTEKTLTPVESLAKAGLIKEAITSFKISRLADRKNDGEVTFGGLDASKFDQQTLVTIDNVNPHGFWEIPIEGAALDGSNLNLTNRTAILDTGTTLLLVPPEDAQAIHQAIPGASRIASGNGSFKLPCTTTASLALAFGGRLFAIDPRDIVFGPVDPNNPTGDCISGIAASNITGPKEWLAGDVFLKNAYFSTNVGRNTVQLAKLT